MGHLRISKPRGRVLALGAVVALACSACASDRGQTVATYPAGNVPPGMDVASMMKPPSIGSVAGSANATNAAMRDASAPAFTSSYAAGAMPGPAPAIASGPSGLMR